MAARGPFSRRQGERHLEESQLGSGRPWEQPAFPPEKRNTPSPLGGCNKNKPAHLTKGLAEARPGGVSPWRRHSHFLAATPWRNGFNLDVQFPPPLERDASQHRSGRGTRRSRAEPPTPGRSLPSPEPAVRGVQGAPRAPCPRVRLGCFLFHSRAIGTRAQRRLIAPWSVSFVRTWEKVAPLAPGGSTGQPAPDLQTNDPPPYDSGAGFPGHSGNRSSCPAVLVLIKTGRMAPLRRPWQQPSPGAGPESSRSRGGPGLYGQSRAPLHTLSVKETFSKRFDTASSPSPLPKRKVEAPGVL